MAAAGALQVFLVLKGLAGLGAAAAVAKPPVVYPPLIPFCSPPVRASRRIPPHNGRR